MVQSPELRPVLIAAMNYLKGTQIETFLFHSFWLLLEWKKINQLFSSTEAIY